jgi:hypothetical protein
MYMTKPPTRSLRVQIPTNMVLRLDALRGSVPRGAYVQQLLEKALQAEEKSAGKR